MSGTVEREAADSLVTREGLGRALFDSSPDCIKIIDLDGVLEAMNVNGQHCLEIDDINAFCGNHWSTMWPPQERAKVNAAIADARTNRIGRFTAFCPTAKGTPKWWDVIVTPVVGVDGLPAHLVVSSRDITEQRAGEENLRAAYDTFRGVVERSPFGVYAVDADFRMALVAAGAQKVFENIRPLIGRDFAEVLGLIWPEPFASEVISRFRHTLLTGEPYNAPGMVERRRDINSVESYDWKIERMTLPDGRLGVVCHFYDLTERQRYEAALRESEQRTHLATEAASIGIWEWNLETNQVRWDAQMFQIHGIAPTVDCTVPFSLWSGMVDPEDWPRQERLLGETVRRLGYGHRQFRISRGDGQLRHIEAVDTVRTGAKGQAEWVVGTNIDITERKLAEDTLRASEERLRLAADVAGIGRGDINYLQDTITLDDRAAALFGMPAGKALPRRDVHARFHPDDIPAIEAKISDSLDPSGSGFMSIDHRTIRPDGSMVWISACKQIEFSARDDLRQRRAVSGILAVLDITARKEHERQIELLMREVNHRSKNLLGVVQAVARQTAKSSPDEFVQRFSERVQALAASQDLLVNSNWRGASLADLVRVQLAHFKDLVGGRIELRGEPIQLSAPAAQTIGMALHELATNAGKYGSLSNAGGRVMIAWHTTKEPAGKRFEMSWTEDGGPPVVAPKRQGFGSTVIDTMAKNGMSGDVVVAFDREGFKWRLECPAAALW